MKQERLSNSEFFVKLAELFTTAARKGYGSVVLTQKRLIPQSDSSATKLNHDDLSDLSLAETAGSMLIRASNAKSRVTKNRKKVDVRKVKLATVVEPNDVDAFFVRYAEICKTGMTGLKKRDRKGKKQKRKKKAKTGSALA